MYTMRLLDRKRIDRSFLPTTQMQSKVMHRSKAFRLNQSNCVSVKVKVKVMLRFFLTTSMSGQALLLSIKQGCNLLEGV